MLSKTPTDAQVNELYELYSSGNFERAILVANDMISRFPDFIFGYKLLAVIYIALGNYDNSIALNLKALDINPNDENILCNLGIAYHEKGLITDAIQYYEQASKINAINPIYLNNLGNAYSDLKQFEVAFAYCAKALEFDPNFEDALNNLSLITLNTKSYEQSLLFAKRALDLNQNSAKAHNNYANALNKLCRQEESINHYIKALQLDPNFFGLYLNIGSTLQDLNKHEEAIKFLTHAKNLEPNSKLLYNMLGRAYQAIGDSSKALECYQVALSLDINYFDAYSNLATLLCSLKEFSEAKNVFNKAINIAEAEYKNDASLIFKEYSITLNNYANMLRDLREIDGAILAFKKAIEVDSGNLTARENLIFTYHYMDNEFDKEHFYEAIEYGKICSKMAKYKFSDWLVDYNASKLRVGFVGGDFKNHPVGYFLENFLAHTKNIEVIAYSSSAIQDDLTQRLKNSLFDFKVIANLNDEDLANEIRNDKVHVLIDLAGFTAGNRLPMFAYKPSLVQIGGWLGFFATTGLQEIDYIIGDDIVTPENEQFHFVEKVVRMPQIHHCFTPPIYENLIQDELIALKNGYITFGCLNNISKITKEAVTVWSKILKNVQNSKLLLKSPQLDSVDVQNALIVEFEQQGITKDRLILSGQCQRFEFLQTYNHIDIALDTFPYTGGTTNMECIYMGVPFITKKGSRFLSHMGESIITNAGLANLIANNSEEYIKKAIDLASDLQQLGNIKNELKNSAKNSPLFNAELFAKNFEDLIFHLWGNFIKN